MSAEPIDSRPGKDCRRCHERRQIHQFPKLAPGRYGDTCRVCTRATKPKLVVDERENGRVCAECKKRQAPSAFKFRHGVRSEVCVSCEDRDRTEVVITRHLCASCGRERAKMATLTERDEVAALVLRVLRQVATGRLGTMRGCPMLGAGGMSQLAAEVLERIAEVSGED